MVLTIDGQALDTAQISAIREVAGKTLEMIDLQASLGIEGEYIEVNRLVLVALAKWAQQSTAHIQSA